MNGPGTPLSESTCAWWEYQRPATYQVESTLIEVPARDATLPGCRLNRDLRASFEVTKGPGRDPGRSATVVAVPTPDRAPANRKR